jgi:hypothetical protein
VFVKENSKIVIFDKAVDKQALVNFSGLSCHQAYERLLAIEIEARSNQVQPDFSISLLIGDRFQIQ